MNASPCTYIIAEAGVNHNGSIDRACDLVDAAATAGADAVKFQTFRAKNVVSRRAPKAQYQLRTTDGQESQFEMIEKLELDEAAHRVLVKRASQRGIRFLSTPFDLPSLQLLTQVFALDVVKIPSGEITNAPFLLDIARTGSNVILSTGMSTLGEVEIALGVLAYGYAGRLDEPGPDAFREAYCSYEGQGFLHARVSLLHCTSEYPAPCAQVNLRAIETLAIAFGLPVGLSDHTEGIHIPVAAVARGASIIEKHFTLDRSLPGPDHAASLEPLELAEMVRAIRDVEVALGDGRKRPTLAEVTNRDVVRRGIVAACTIEPGDVFSEDNLTAKRPGTGASPMHYWNILGKVAKRRFVEDEPVDY
jgi:N-acetylneuraminate synthase